LRASGAHGGAEVRAANGPTEVIEDPSPAVVMAQPHRRYKTPFSTSGLLVSAERTSRPWLGRSGNPPAVDLPTYDPSCYLCPGNVRANGKWNPKYESTFVFTNDFAALRPDAPDAAVEDRLLRAKSERGTARSSASHRATT